MKALSGIASKICQRPNPAQPNSYSTIGETLTKAALAMAPYSQNMATRSAFAHYPPPATLPQRIRML